MSAIALILGLLASLALMVLRSLACDEMKGLLQRRVRASVDATIASLPEDLQARWGEEWRAELETVITMPLAATQFARDIREAADAFVTAAAERVPAATAVQGVPHSRQKSARKIASEVRHRVVSTPGRVVNVLDGFPGLVGLPLGLPIAGAMGAALVGVPAAVAVAGAVVVAIAVAVGVIAHWFNDSFAKGLVTGVGLGGIGAAGFLVGVALAAVAGVVTAVAVIIGIPAIAIGMAIGVLRLWGW